MTNTYESKTNSFCETSLRLKIDIIENMKIIKKLTEKPTFAFFEEGKSLPEIEKMYHEAQERINWIKQKVTELENEGFELVDEHNQVSLELKTVINKKNICMVKDKMVDVVNEIVEMVNKFLEKNELRVGNLLIELDALKTERVREMISDDVCGAMDKVVEYQNRNTDNYNQVLEEISSVLAKLVKKVDDMEKNVSGLYQSCIFKTDFDKEVRMLKLSIDSLNIMKLKR